MTAGYMIGRVRRAMNAMPIGGVDISTRDLARAASEYGPQLFSDEEILWRLHSAEQDIMTACDALHFPSAIAQYNGPWNPVDGSYLRVLENRVFRGTERCLMVPSDDARVRRLSRAAADARPVAVVSGNRVAFFPDDTGAAAFVVQPPRLITLADVAAGNDEMMLDDVLEEAVTQHVLKSIRLTQSQGGSEQELALLMSRLHGRLYREEMEPFSRTTKPMSTQSDTEVSVENAV